MARRRTELVKADDSGTDLLPLVPEEGTGVLEIRRGTDVLEGHGRVPGERPEDILAEPPDARDVSAELAAPPRRKLPWLTLLLSAGVVAVAAFAGGAIVEKNHLNGSSGGSGFPAASGARSAGSNGTTGAGRTFGAGTGTGAGGGVTFGTVKLVDGSTLYVTDAQGAIVKVTTGGSTKVTESKEGKVSDLKAGQTVTVRGTQSASGDIAATTVTEGATLPTGFGGGGGFGGGAGGGNQPFPAGGGN